MVNLKTAQFAKLFIVAEQFNVPAQDNPTGDNLVPIGSEDSPNQLSLTYIGLAQNLTFSNNFGTQSVNFIGTPLNVPVPGYFGAQISMDKATVDHKGWDTLANLNPLSAYLPSSYDFANKAPQVDALPDDMASLKQSKALNNPIDQRLKGRVPRFFFVIGVYDKISDDVSRPTGIYIAMLQSFNQSLRAGDAVIIQGVTAIGRPIVGGWTALVEDIYNNSPFYAFTTSELPQLR